MPGLFRHTWRYSLSGILSTLASLVSFPILTRLLSVEDYGLMSTVALVLSLLVALGKLGMQKAAVRFFNEARSAQHAGSQNRFVATLIYGMLGLGALTMVLWIAAVLVVPESWLGATGMKTLLLLSSALILIRVGDSAFSNLLYAQERSGVLSVYNVAKRYTVLVVVVGALLVFPPNASAFFAASVVAETLAMLAIAGVVTRSMSIWPGDVSASLFRSMAAYGLPMVGMEMAWLLLSMGDRYVINHLLGAEAVGIYSASYNLCDYIKAATLTALSTAAVPMYMRIWEQQGRAATEGFFEGYARAHFATAFLIGALVTASAAPLITILASAKYVQGAMVVPWLMLGLALESYVAIATAGLMLKKRTSVLFYLAGAAAVLNLGLNFALIPVLGVTGSAVSTLIAFAALLGCALLAGRRELRVHMPLPTLMIGLAGFALSSWAALRVSTGHPLIDLLVRSAVVVALYAPLMWFGDGALRQDLQKQLPALWTRMRRS